MEVYCVQGFCKAWEPNARWCNGQRINAWPNMHSMITGEQFVKFFQLKPLDIVT